MKKYILPLSPAGRNPGIPALVAEAMQIVLVF